MTQDDVIVVGDGPTGWSAALLLAKTGFAVRVVGRDESPVNRALLRNYSGFDEITGPAFLASARAQAERFGASYGKARVGDVTADAAGPFRVATPEGTFEAGILVLATGFAADLASRLGLERGPEGVRVDLNGRTSRENVYAGGALTRGLKSQLATSVGDGAAIAIDILSKKRGKPSHDYDVLTAKP